MKVFLFLCLLLPVSMAKARLPEGIWYSDQFLADDGSYGVFYRDWLFVSETEIVQLITLGAHYSKTKFPVVSSGEGIAEIRDPESGSVRRIVFTQEKDILTLSFGASAPTKYQRKLAGPEIGTQPDSHPRIQVASKWCVDQDCVDILYSEYQSEHLCNLNAGFKPSVTWNFEGPTQFIENYGIDMDVMAFSYRLKNDGSRLSSFSTSLFFTVASKTQSTILKKSGVLTLQEGLLTRLTGTFENHKLSVEFSIRRIP